MEIHGKVLIQTCDYLIYSRGLRIFKYEVENRSHICMGSLGSRLSVFLSSIHILARLLRLGIHHLFPVQGGYYVIYNKKICCLDASFRVVGAVENINGSPPLNPCVLEGVLYYGEYSNNPQRRPVGLYAYNGCGQQQIFEMKGIRHIHGVFSIDGTMYLCTGDADDESGIYRVTGDTFEQILGGEQRFRVVTLLGLKGKLIFGSDAPGMQNHFFSYCPDSGDLKRLGEAESSVFFGKKINGRIVFSTAVEPSEVNKTNCAAVYCLEGSEVKKLYSSKKDYFHFKYFQYGMLKFPCWISDNACGVWVYNLGTERSGYSRYIEFPAT